MSLTALKWSMSEMATVAGVRARTGPRYLGGCLPPPGRVVQQAGLGSDPGGIHQLRVPQGPLQRDHQGQRVQDDRHAVRGGGIQADVACYCRVFLRVRASALSLEGSARLLRKMAGDWCPGSLQGTRSSGSWQVTTGRRAGGTGRCLPGR